jgi:hypothetical protein
MTLEETIREELTRLREAASRSNLLRDESIALIDAVEKLSEAATPLIERIPVANEEVTKEWRSQRYYQVKVSIGELMDLQDALAAVAETLKGAGK